MSVRYHTSVPATSANLGPGYDVLGLALNIPFTTTAFNSDEWTVQLHGEGADLLPTDETNLLVRAYDYICDSNGWKSKPLSIVCRNSIPLARGLGSSASAIVTGMALAQLVHSGNIDKTALFPVAAKFEGHPDNVAAALFGGLREIVNHDTELEAAERPVSLNISVLLVIPPELKSTARLRKVVPESLEQAEQLQNQQNLARVLTGLATGNPAELVYSGSVLRHQPYRLAVQPTSDDIFKLLKGIPAIAGVYLSGAGTTVAGWITGTGDPVLQTEELLSANNITADVQLVQVDHIGLEGSISNDQALHF